MNIQLKPEQEKLIQAQIATGRYTSAEEVVDIAFRLFDKLHSDYTDWIEETRQKVDVAIVELERGEGLDGETVVMDILEKFRHARSAQE
ncbi:MAG: type II toxin-antitoxin system ParD family antitoxin [Tolypothrix sp. T3-bin4]|nr:type II toxin-antitoxin system ParD family antitoxin [Tolypothrix sp. Co-bin9]MBD0303869.1 type II toxin-antitoxin system ParD family antitoxin [Tolypothrix sp. T3-bin4]